MPNSGSAYAWWNLSHEQKVKLDQMRDAGMFGGTHGQPKYFWIQEGTINPEGAAKAGITPTHWLDEALESAPIADDIAVAIGS
jgi:hypothetical protein